MSNFSMADQFRGLAMGDLIGGPLIAACDAQVRLADATEEAAPAVELGVDDDLVAKAELAVARLHDLTDHLVAHDAWIADGNRAVEDLVVSAADAAVRHPDQHLVRAAHRPRHLIPDERPWRRQDHRLHGATLDRKPLTPARPD